VENLNRSRVIEHGVEIELFGNTNATNRFLEKGGPSIEIFKLFIEKEICYAKNRSYS